MTKAISLITALNPIHLGNGSLCLFFTKTRSKFSFGAQTVKFLNMNYINVVYMKECPVKYGLVIYFVL